VYTETVEIAFKRRHWQWTGIGFLLCLLATLFAVEAKMAWYGPKSAPAIQISSSKLQQAEAPRLVANTYTATRTVPEFLEIGVILALVLMMGTTTAASIRSFIQPAKRISWNFPPQLFFRPPPTL
jgi:hypothetical protein